MLVGTLSKGIKVYHIRNLCRARESIACKVRAEAKCQVFAVKPSKIQIVAV